MMGRTRDAITTTTSQHTHAVTQTHNYVGFGPKHFTLFHLRNDKLEKFILAVVGSWLFSLSHSLVPLSAHLVNIFATSDVAMRFPKPWTEFNKNFVGFLPLSSSSSSPTSQPPPPPSKRQEFNEFSLHILDSFIVLLLVVHVFRFVEKGRARLTNGQFQWRNQTIEFDGIHLFGECWWCKVNMNTEMRSAAVIIISLIYSCMRWSNRISRFRMKKKNDQIRCNRRLQYRCVVWWKLNWRRSLEIVRFFLVEIKVKLQYKLWLMDRG